jgi:hypothetical protein
MEKQDKGLVLVGNQMLVYQGSKTQMKGEERSEEEMIENSRRRLVRSDQNDERIETTLSKRWEKIRAMLEKEYIIMSRRVKLVDIIGALLMGVTESWMAYQVYLALLHMPPVVKISSFI